MSSTLKKNHLVHIFLLGTFLVPMHLCHQMSLANTKPNMIFCALIYLVFDRMSITRGFLSVAASSSSTATKNGNQIRRQTTANYDFDHQEVGHLYTGNAALNI